MNRPIAPIISQSLSENILSGLQRGPDLLIGVGQLDGLLASLIPDARVTASVTHHLDHFRTGFSVFFVGVAHGSVEGGVVVEAGERVTFEVLDVEESVHGVICIHNRGENS